jgi:hypothetical protein
MTAKYPVDVGDEEGIVDAVNYLLSGPSGLGQNYAGFSSYAPTYIRPTTRQPFSLPIDTTLYPGWSLEWDISNITVSGTNPSQFIEVTFAPGLPNITLTDPPFQFGDRLLITGVTPSDYDARYTVISCTTTTVVLSQSKDYTWPAYTSGGQLVRDFYDFAVSTDCNARVTVYGPTDQVFVSAQVILERYYYDNRPITVPTTSEESAWELVFQINRYRGTPTTSTNDNDFVFSNPVTIAEFTILENTNTINDGEIVGGVLVEVPTFTTILDKPSFGYYWYILEIDWRTINISNGEVGAVAIKSGTGAGVPATYTGVAGIAAGSPFTTAATFDVVLTAGTSQPYTTANTTITAITPVAGENMPKGETITILGTSLGGATPANDLILTATEVNGYGPARPAQIISKLRSLSAQVIKQ